MAEKRERPEQKEIESSLKRLKQQFGRNLDSTVLEAVLEMHEFNYAQTEAFLQAEQNDQNAYNYQNFNPASASQDDSLPENYFQPPAGFAPLAAAAEASGRMVTEEEEVDQRLKELFTKQSTFNEHFIAQREQLLRYLSTLLVLVKSGMEVKDNAKARALAALWSHKRFALADYLLSPQSNRGAGFGFGLTEILKAVNLLDSGRKIRVLEKRMNLLQKQQKVRQRTLGRVTSSINDLKREPVQGSLSGALIRHIRRWVLTLPPADLQFYAIHLPREPWKELADLLHLNPKKDFAEPWFLEVAFGAPAPEEGIVAACAQLSRENVLEVVKRHAPPYTFLRKSRELLSDEVMTEIARYTPLETLIWWYEEMRNEHVDGIIRAKLEAGEPLRMGYGKLMERLLTFKAMDAPFLPALIPAAEEKLQGLRLPLEPPVVCFGDASYSMDVAIRVSTIIASLMTAITHADLRFFNTESIVPPKLPRTIADVLELTMSVRADKLTAPAAALLEYYEKRIPVKTFIIVTDEVENLPHGGDFFAQLFYKYRRDVQPDAELVFVSFLPNQNARGRMVRALEQLGIKPRLEVRLDGARPDLTKLDSMLALLSSGTREFATSVGHVQASLASSEWEKDAQLLEGAFAS